MTVLRSIESKLESLFEGVFGRAFRANVQPVELARKLVKEMDEHRNVSVSRVYVPERVHDLPLARRPRAVLGLRGLAARRAPGVPRRARAARELRRCSRRRGSSSRPTTTSRSASSGSRPGSRTARGRGRRDAPAAQAAARRDDDLQAGQQPTEAARPTSSACSAEVAVARLRRQAARDRRAARRCSAGRRTCDIQVPDPNVSRRHAEVRQEGADVLARRPRLDERHRGAAAGASKRLELEDGTRFTLGSTEIAFSRELRSDRARPRSRRRSSPSRSPSSSCSTSSSGASSARRRATCGCRRSR